MTVLVRDPLQRSVAAAVAVQLSASLAIPPAFDAGDDYAPDSPRWRDQSLSKGAPGVAVLHGVRAQDGYGSADLVHAWLARASRDDLSGASGAGLWFGAPAVAFAIETAAPGRYPQTMDTLDTAIRRLIQSRLHAAYSRIAAAARPALSEFDLVRGLTGLGAYLFRRDSHGDLLSEILTYLVQLTEPVTADDEAGRNVPGWWTADLPSGVRADSHHGGHTDLGMAHGITGPLALLALAMRRGITVPGHADAIERICRWLEEWRHDGPDGAWWPERIGLTDVRIGRSLCHGPARPSWCYGTTGIARAQQLAAMALRDTERQQLAERALDQCLADPVQLSRIIDPTLCHGWAGLVATASAAAADALTPDLRTHLPHLVEALIDHAHDPLRDQLPGLIDGTAGIALTLHTIAADGATGWQSSLLIN